MSKRFVWIFSLSSLWILICLPVSAQGLKELARVHPPKLQKVLTENIEDFWLQNGEVMAVDPRNTSKTCSQCGHLAAANRERRFLFLCRGCGYFDHADVNAAINSSKAAAVMQREASERAVA